MPDVVARTMAAICGFLLVGAIAVLYVTSRPSAGAQEVVAEFQDAFPLLEGMYVRVDGAIAGSIGPIEVTEEGLARVTLVLDDSIEKPSNDATAAIRQQDTTGDSYVAFEPGGSGKSLPVEDGMPTIRCDADGPNGPCASTLTTPRFDDLLNAFGPSERAGVKLILIELSKALDERGDDVNAAALELRPALVAGNEALAEVESQNAALRSVITDAEDVTGQAASRRRELARLIGSLDTTLAATAAESEGLDAGLERLPQAAREARTTMSALTRAAEAGGPLARELQAAAPGLATAIEAAPSFFGDAGAAIDDVTPTLELTRRLLIAGEPTIRADPERVVTGAFDLAPALSNLLTGVLGDDNTIKALFGDDSGGTGPGTLDRSGLGALAVEPGNQPGYPAEHADRAFIRLSAVFNCETFGVPVEPGCLAGVLGPRKRSAEARSGAAEREGRSGRAKDGPGMEEGRLPSAPDLPGLPDPPDDDRAAEDILDFLLD
ncbi:MAG: MlaD family protein [Solirubrobacterales bacterium]